MVSNVGVYIRGLSVNRQGTPKAAAKKAKDHGVSFVPILAIWQNKDNTLFSNGRGADLIIKYAEAFKAAGIDPWIWGYPWAGKHTEYVDRMSAVTEKCSNGEKVLLPPMYGLRLYPLKSAAVWNYHRP
jgi:hypothetical protein